MTNLAITGLMAADPDGVIGKGDRLPWHYPDELEQFRSLTQGHVLIMGRKTYETLPPALLKTRYPIVLSRQHSLADTAHGRHAFVTSIEACLEAIQGRKKQQIFMIGGAEIAHLFLERGLLSTFILTKIHQFYEGDTVLNLKYLEGWPSTTLRRTEDFTIYKLHNPQREQENNSRVIQNNRR